MTHDYWQDAQKYRNPAFCDEYDLRIQANPKQRHGPGGTKAKTRNWEALVSEAVTESAPESPIINRVGLRVLFMINSKNPPVHDLDNAIKSLSDALNRRAYHDDKQIDYLEALRVWSPDMENRIKAEVYERAN